MDDECNSVIDDIQVQYTPPEEPLPSYMEWRMCRITPDNDDIKMDTILQHSMITTYVIAEEHSSDNVRHFHIVFGNNTDMSTAYRRKNFNDEMYGLLKTEKRGQTILQHTNNAVTDLDRAFPYALKDGLYLNSPDLDAWVRYWYLISYPKPPGYKKEKQQLDCKFLETNSMLPEEYWEQLGVLRSKYSLGIAIHKLDEDTCSVMVRREPDEIKNLRKKSKLFS